MESQNGDIFAAISHEIRRKIIQMLAEKPRTFSDLQKELGLESPALAFHLKKLNGLITKNEQGYYELTPLGVRAYEVIKQIQGEKASVIKRDEPEEEKGGFLSKLVSGLSELPKVLSDLPSGIVVSGITLKEVFNGSVPLKPNLSVQVDGGKVELSKGDPYAIIKCIDESSFQISTINDELKISLDGCVAKISYPPLNSFRGELDGGIFRINNSISNFSVEIDGGTLHIDADNVVNGKIELDGGAFHCKLKYAREGLLNVEIDGGAGNLDISVPPDVGVVFNKDVDGGVVKGGKSIIKDKNVVVNISVNGGVVTVKTGS